MPSKVAAQASAPTAAPNELLGFHSRPAMMTDPRCHAALVATQPSDLGALVRIVQGLVFHEHFSFAYGVTIPEPRKAEPHVRTVERMLDCALALDDRPLSTARPIDRRIVGVCHHFVLLLIAMLRDKGIPARARNGFGDYFRPGYYEEHVVCEYWDEAKGGWLFVDPQFDEVWIKTLKIGHDPLDVPRDRFLIAGEAWRTCRAGKADPSKFGISVAGLHGLAEIAQELLRDVAALNNCELLLWDVWGAMPKPDALLSAEQLSFFDKVAALTLKPDANFAELRALYEDGERLPAPARVFNARLQRLETP